MLDQQHWQIRRDALDNGTDPLALRRGKPRQRFVQQQHAWCGGERHAHVEKALATIGQVARFGLFNARETEIADGSVGFGIDRVDRQGIGDRIEAARMPRLDGETDVFANAERRKKVGNLERAADACSGDLLRCMSGDRLAHQGYRALVRRIHTRQEIERRGLAGAIWADQRMQRAVCDGDINALNGLDPPKTLDDVACGKHRSADVRFGPQKFWQRQEFDAARRHCGIFCCLLAKRRHQPLADTDQAGR